MDRENKKCSCARKSGRRKNSAGTDKEEETKLAEPLTKKDLPIAVSFRRNGQREGGSQQKIISNNRQNHDKWTVYVGLDTKRKAKKRVKWRMLTLQ